MRPAFNEKGFPRSSRRFRRPGAAVVELTLTVSVFMMLVFGTVEFAYYYYTDGMLSSSAREGARAGVPTGATNAQVEASATNALATCNWATGNYTIAITDLSNNPIDVLTATPGTQIRVSVSATWGTIGNGFRPLGLIGATKIVSGVCVMRKEG